MAGSTPIRMNRPLFFAAIGFVAAAIANAAISMVIESYVESVSMSFHELGKFFERPLTILCLGIALGFVLAILVDAIREQRQGYQEWWHDVDIFTVWQTACLWAGERPGWPIAHDRPSYPILKMIEEDIALKRIAVHTARLPNDQKGWDKLHRTDIRMYAQDKIHPPKFPF